MKRLFLVFVFGAYFLISNTVFAAITSPYTVDEKAQVLFGDSVATSTYNGLENYATNYVDGYLHITFTYTHQTLGIGCCSANFPPRLYVTDTDPTATTSALERLNQVVYQLGPATHNPEHITDWYLYDIQFDATGYVAKVKRGGEVEILNEHTDIAGLISGDWAALANLAPFDGNPATIPTVNTMSFTPLSITESTVTSTSSGQATTTPVIIVPGIMGTRLVEGINLIWPDTTQIITSITDDFLDSLKMDLNGISLNSNIATSTIIRDINNADYFTSLLNSLVAEDYIENTDLFENPYDWRIDIKISALALKNKIDEIKTQRGVNKVSLVAHSMGGLVVKKYLKDYGGDSIDTFIDIGTPHLGSPGAYKILMYGDDLGVKKFFGLIGINGDRIKEISQNMPSVYQLLPSRNYFDESNNDYKYYVFDGTSGSDRLTFDQTSSYLQTAGRNSSLVTRADTFHQEIDNLNPSSYGVETYNIVGCGTPTIGQFYILEDGEHPIYNIKMINGDGTVPLKSAEALTASTTYYVKSAQHAVMPSTSGVKELITSLLSTTTTPDLSPYSNLSLTSSGCTIPNGKIVSFHSPIELHIYDSSGNHTGPDANGDIENDIAGVTYEVIGDNKFAYLPDGVDYTIKGNATSEGSFDIRIQELVNGEVATTTVFADIPLTTVTKTQFNLGSSVPSQISVDSDNDNTFDHDYGISTTTAGVLESTGALENLTTNNPQLTTDTVNSKPVENTPVSPVIPISPITNEAISTTSIIYSPTIYAVKKETVVTTSTSTPQYENTAIVYKSLTYKVRSAFTKVWGWIKSKL